MNLKNPPAPGWSKDILYAPQAIAHLLEDDGVFPNNERLPLLVYQGVLKHPERNPAAVFESLFEQNRWPGAWRNGIFARHHYHSTAHEALGIFSGRAKVQFGGPSGVVLSVERGDVVIIPAGVAHKNLGASGDFGCVGAYPVGQRWDTCYGESGERPRAERAIVGVPLPAADPLYGADGPLMGHWR